MVNVYGQRLNPFQILKYEACIMKLLSLVKGLTLLSFTIGVTLTIGQPIRAESTTFFCGTHKGLLATIAKTSQGEFPIVPWQSQYFSDIGYTSQRRCQEASERFQNYYNSGNLNYIFAESVNQKSVVCIARNKGDHCLHILFDLIPGSNPTRTLQQLLNITDDNLRIVNEIEGRFYINMREYLNTVEQGRPSPSPYIINKEKLFEEWLADVTSYKMTGSNATYYMWSTDVFSYQTVRSNGTDYITSSTFTSLIEDINAYTNQQFDFSDYPELSGTSTKLEYNSERLFDDILDKNNESFLSQLDTPLELLYSDSDTIVSIHEIDDINIPEAPKSFDEPRTTGMLIVAILILIGYKR